MYDLCFRDHGKPKTCFPVYLSISPPEATEAAYVRDEEEEIRRNGETVRVTFNIPAWITGLRNPQNIFRDFRNALCILDGWISF